MGGEDIFIGGTKVISPDQKHRNLAHSPENSRYPNLSSHLGSGRTRTHRPTQAVEADNSWYPNLSTAWVSTEHALGTTLRASGAASPGCDIFPTTSQPSSGKDTEGIISTHRI